MSNRHLARTIALQTLFAWDFNGKNGQNTASLLVGT
jgi:transcription termination factor NusB